MITLLLTGEQEVNNPVTEIAIASNSPRYTAHKGSVDLNGDFWHLKAPLCGNFRRQKSLKPFLAHSVA